MRTISAVTLAAWITTAATGIAGDGNTLNLLQVAVGAGGNTIYIDQSEASASMVAGDRAGVLPASQIGTENVANLTVTGNGGSIAINQNNALTGFAIGNTADGVISGLFGFGSILQLGDGNTASLTVNSPQELDPAAGSITQTGFFNDASLEVNGAGAEGTLRQIGTGNSNALIVEGTGTTASFTQIGNNAINPQGVTVISNGGSVAITQYSF